MILRPGPQILWHPSHWKVGSMSRDLESRLYDQLSNKLWHKWYRVSFWTQASEKSALTLCLLRHLLSESRYYSMRMANSGKARMQRNWGASSQQPQLNFSWHPALTYHPCEWHILKTGPPAPIGPALADAMWSRGLLSLTALSRLV